MAITEDAAKLTALGLCLHCGVLCTDVDDADHALDCPHALGLGAARGDLLVDGERCSGPCRLPLAPGEHYVTGEGGAWCLACDALRQPTGDEA